jgi:hypothetical protein
VEYYEMGNFEDPKESNVDDIAQSTVTKKVALELDFNWRVLYTLKKTLSILAKIKTQYVKGH